MVKKLILFLVVALILIGGGFFWWQNQAGVRELNKTLPEGVRVEKSLFGKEYKVVNKIDGYEFPVPINPESWNKMGKIEYKDLTSDTLGYRLNMSDVIQEVIDLESALTVKNPNGLIIAELSSLHFNVPVNLDDFAKEFQVKFTPSRSGSSIEITSKIDNLLMGGRKVLKLSELTTLRMKDELVTPLFYLFSSDFTIYIMPIDLNENIINQIIANGEW